MERKDPRRHEQGTREENLPLGQKRRGRAVMQPCPQPATVPAEFVSAHLKVGIITLTL
jgi:hypothetical protein